MNSQNKNKFNIGDTVKFLTDNITYKIDDIKYNSAMITYEYHIYDPGNIQNQLWTSESNLTVTSAQHTFYNTRAWLNSDDSPSTGSIVCFSGLTKYSDGIDTNCFIEMADCHQKARIHKTFSDTMEDWILKVETLHKNIENYLTYLKETYHK